MIATKFNKYIHLIQEKTFADKKLYSLPPPKTPKNKQQQQKQNKQKQKNKQKTKRVFIFEIELFVLVK